MSLYDTIQEITKQQATKTETGDTRIYGVMVGVVAKNYHKDMPGRVCVTILTRNKDANELQWARLAMMSGGSNWGTYFMPEIGDQVLLVFEGGNIEKPYVIGCLPKDGSAFLTNSVSENNEIKRIVTRNGSTLIFTDDKEDDGKKDTILLQTSDKRHSILLDNENELIRISDKKKEDVIEMITTEGRGSLKITIKSSIEIKVGDKIKVILNGASGTVQIDAEQITLEGSNGVALKSSQSVKLEGAIASVKGNSGLTLESGGPASLAGNPIKIG